MHRISAQKLTLNEFVNVGFKPSFILFTRLVFVVRNVVSTPKWLYVLGWSLRRMKCFIYESMNKVSVAKINSPGSLACLQADTIVMISAIMIY